MLSKTLVMAALAAGVPQGPALHYQALTGAKARAVATMPDGRDAVLIFWRGDCAPCIDEMRHLADYRRAAGRTRVLAIALQPATDAVAAANRLDFSSAEISVSPDDPAQTLVAFGGAPARLPLSVHVDGKGHVLAARHGLLGTDIVKAWTH